MRGPARFHEQGRSPLGVDVMTKILVLTLSLCLTACDDPGNASFQARESVEQIHVWGAEPATPIILERGEREIASGVTDEQGSHLFRRVPPAQGYIVRVADEYTRPLRVMSEDSSQPEADFYREQKLSSGFQYLKMRDGTSLSAYVTLPGPIESGPYPTVINYSGYAPSRPDASVGISTLFCNEFPILCDAPNAETSLFAGLLGYATVNVNIRGTGCSGGAYDYFERLQILDGYDVVEIVAAQDWVLHHQVGMVGLSYPGITQLFVAREKPPGLAAISPLSVIGNTVTTLVPGGILNDGFALQWVDKVLDKARPYGQGWEQARVDAGDALCAENQLLHSQRVDNVEQARNTPYYIPELLDPLNPEKWVHEINVPVFLSGAWQDEQTGPFFAVLMDRFKASPDHRFWVQNGVHIDAYAPRIFQEWKYFLDLFVARRVPRVSDEVRGFAPLIFDEIFEAGMSFPPERFLDVDTHEAALARWRGETPLNVVFESGAGNLAGAPSAAFERSYDTWPPENQVARRWYLQNHGELSDNEPTEMTGTGYFLHDPEAGQRGVLPSGSVWSRAPAYDWRVPEVAHALVFESDSLQEDLVMLGTGSVDLWVRTSAEEADVEVTLSEVRPDDQEMYVQSGWLRASKRKLGAESTELYPAPTYLQEDAHFPVAGEWFFARIAIAPFGHVFRSNSRIRLTIDTPGDSRSDWRFDLAEVALGSQIEVAHNALQTSSVALPVLDGESAATPLPPCTLRGQPCRAYVAYNNETNDAP